MKFDMTLDDSRRLLFMAAILTTVSAPKARLLEARVECRWLVVNAYTVKRH